MAHFMMSQIIPRRLGDHLASRLYYDSLVARMIAPLEASNLALKGNHIHLRCEFPMFLTLRGQAGGVVCVGITSTADSTQKCAMYVLWAPGRVRPGLRA